MPSLAEMFASESMIAFYIITIQGVVGVGFVLLNLIALCFVLGLVGWGMFKIWSRITLGVW